MTYRILEVVPKENFNPRNGAREGVTLTLQPRAGGWGVQDDYDTMESAKAQLLTLNDRGGGSYTILPIFRFDYDGNEI